VAGGAGPKINMSSAATHTIRLRGPWQLQPLAATVLMADGTTQREARVLPPGATTQIPSDWSDSLGVDFRGRVLYSRRFGCPTGLEPADRVALLVERVDAVAQVAVNGHPLGEIRLADGERQWSIKRLLQDRNLLEITVELPRLTPHSTELPRPGREGRAGGLIGEVRLVITAG